MARISCNTRCNPRPQSGSLRTLPMGKNIYSVRSVRADRVEKTSGRRGSREGIPCCSAVLKAKTDNTILLQNPKCDIILLVSMSPRPRKNAVYDSTKIADNVVEPSTAGGIEILLRHDLSVSDRKSSNYTTAFIENAQLSRRRKMAMPECQINGSEWPVPISVCLDVPSNATRTSEVSYQRVRGLQPETHPPRERSSSPSRLEVV